MGVTHYRAALTRAERSVGLAAWSRRTRDLPTSLMIACACSGLSAIFIQTGLCAPAVGVRIAGSFAAKVTMTPTAAVYAMATTRS